MSLTRKERENRPKKLDISHEDFIRVWVKVYKAGGKIEALMLFIQQVHAADGQLNALVSKVSRARAALRKEGR